MKKVFYSLLLLAGFQGFSQMTLTSYNPEDSSVEPELIEDGGVWTTSTVNEEGGTLYFYINNAYNEDINIKARVESITNDDGSDFQFCFGQLCVFSIEEGTVYTGFNDYVTIPAGGTNVMW